MTESQQGYYDAAKGLPPKLGMTNKYNHSYTLECLIQQWLPEWIDGNVKKSRK